MKRLEPLEVGLLGTTLIEASAGTGKTYAITTLYVRLVLERGLGVAEILVVTYTRAATAELRDRIRRRLRDALAAIERGGDSNDETLDRLSRARNAEGQRDGDRAKLTNALRAFDQAAIFTIHSFCQRVLADSAFESGVPFDTDFITDQSALVAEIGRDFWARELYRAEPGIVRYLRGAPNPLTPEKLIELAARASASQGMPVLPSRDAVAAGSGGDPLAAWQRARGEAATLWSKQRSSILELLTTSKALNGNKYRKTSVLGAWSTSMDATLAECNVGIPGTFKQFVKFTPTGLLDGCKKNQSPPSHAFFDACVQVQEASDGLSCVRMTLLLDLVDYARRELDSRKRALGVQSFDDLLHRLATALDGPGGVVLAGAIRRRYRGALIDEFQDTDPVQYRVFSSVYQNVPEDVSLFLIGDPKQAIYGFRGADVFAYMDARRDAGDRCHTLDTNWRSDPAMVRGVNTLFERAGHTFVFDDIEFNPVCHSPEASDGLGGALEGRAALEIVLVNSDGRGNKSGRIAKDWANANIPARVARDIARVLADGGTLAGKPVVPGDIAVLVRKNRQAMAMQDALRALGIPSVVEGDASVFDTEDARDVERVLSAVANPSDSRAVVSALTTTLLGVSGDAVSKLRTDETAWDVWLEKFHRWHDAWEREGFIQAYRKLLSDEGVPRRVLTLAAGERRLTNLYHIGELLQAQVVGARLGPLALIQWLQLMRTDKSARADGVGSSGQIRLESDADAVKLVTVHKSKGLEYPIVYCPFLWDGALLFKSERDRVRFHEPAGDNVLTLDIGSADIDEHRELSAREALAEGLRLVYVALTRSKHLCSIVWGPFSESEKSPLGYLLHQPAEFLPDVAGLAAVAEHIKKLDDAALRADLDRLAAQSGGAISVRDFGVESEVRYSASEETSAILSPRSTTRVLQPAGRLSSFTALTASGQHHGSDVRDVDRDQGRGSGHGTDEGASSEEESPRISLADFPRGARVGSMLHEVFEYADFTADGPDRIETALDSALARFGLDLAHKSLLLPALEDVVNTPMVSPRVPFAPRLADVGRGSRIDEMEFLFPVGGGGLGTDGWAVSARALGDILTSRSDAPWPESYPNRISSLGFTPLAGFMRGFVDLIFCHDERWYVVDYKSNFLGETVADYRADRLAEAMARGHYYLQYLVYVVALHRYLSVRLPNYDYEQHMGGVYYLFLRGMHPSNPAGTGVFGDRPPASLILDLSDAFGHTGEIGAR